jgi:hypothetical protein
VGGGVPEAVPATHGVCAEVEALAEMRGRVLFAGKVQEIIGSKQAREEKTFKALGHISEGGVAARHAWDCLAEVAREVQAAGEIARRP